MSGAAYTLGGWFGFDTRWGFEFDAMVLGQYQRNFTMAVGPQVLSRPFFNVLTGAGDATPIAAPLGNFTQSSGNVNATVTSQWWGFNSDMQWKLFGDWNRYFSFILGYRFADLNEALNIIDTRNGFKTTAPTSSVSFFGATFGGAAAAPPNQVQVIDFFGTHNVFEGGEVGFDFEYHYRRWVLNWAARLGIGVTHEILNIQGFSSLTVTAGATPNVVPGGLLAVASNIGKSSQDQFALMPESKLQLGYQLTRNVEIGIGYDFQYLSRVIRPFDQIDLNVNPNQIPTSFGGNANAAAGTNGGAAGAFGAANAAPVRPIRPFTQSDFFAQGIDVMLNFHY
jgi:hypothetical protein